MFRRLLGRGGQPNAHCFSCVFCGGEGGRDKKYSQIARVKKVKSMSLKSLRAEGLVRIYLREKEREDVLFGAEKNKRCEKGKELKGCRG